MPARVPLPVFVPNEQDFTPTTLKLHFYAKVITPKPPETLLLKATPPPAALRPWLEDSASFMKRARHHSLDPQIQVLNQSWLYPSEEERQDLHIPLRQYVYCREVLIHHQALPLLYAKALIPRTTLKGQGRQLLHLGQQALGSFLFAQPDLERSPFEFKPYALPAYAPTPLWGRRSAFYFQAKELWLTEVFLPGLIDHL